MAELLTKKCKKDLELVLDCVMPYIQHNDDLNSVSLVSKNFFDIDSKTRKHVTIHVHFLPDPSRLTLRFPNLESLTLKSYYQNKNTAIKCHIPVTSWIQQISVKFECLKSLSIRNMVVSTSDLQLLAATRGSSLRSLEIWRCKMSSDDGLIDIAKCCIELRNLRLNIVHIDGRANWKWLHELALCNTVMESLSFHDPFHMYDMEDVTRLAKKCSNSLVSLNISPRSLSDFREVFEHAKKFDYFGDGIIDEDGDYSGFKFPPNIRGLRILYLGEASFLFLLPYLNQLRELDLSYKNLEHDCQCILFKRCPSLEVLVTKDTCGDEGLQVISKFCKKLRKLTHRGWVTHTGLAALAQGCPNLDYLSVNSVNLSDISNETLACVGIQLKNLRDFRFRLRRENNITDSSLDNGVRDMLMGCSKLEKLDIGLCFGGLTDVGLGYIGKYGHNLRSLFLRKTGESDVGLFELLKGCPKLRKLRLMRCPFSEQAISTFVFNINSLRYIWAASDYHPFLLLTRPMVSDKVLTEVYITLAEKLYRLALQLVADGSGPGSVKITYTSSRARATDDIDTPLVRDMVAKGIQKERDTLGESSEKPLKIIVRIANVESRFTTAVSEFGVMELQGCVKDGVPHLTYVGAFDVDVSLEGNIILCRHVDEGNTISRVTSILVEENENINSMSVGRPAPRKRAVMVIGIDEKPSDEALKKINEIPAVDEFVFLAL